MTGFLLTLIASDPHVLHFFQSGVFMLSALLAYARREPVRVAAILLAAVLVAVSIVTGTSIVVLLGEVAGVVGLFEKVRSQVTPMVDVVVHPADAADKAV